MCCLLKEEVRDAILFPLYDKEFLGAFEACHNWLLWLLA